MFFDDDDAPMMLVILRGYSNDRQIIEHTLRVKNRAIAWEYAATYFGCEASHSECDRYTVETRWI